MIKTVALFAVLAVVHACNFEAGAKCRAGGNVCIQKDQPSTKKGLCACYAIMMPCLKHYECFGNAKFSGADLGCATMQCGTTVALSPLFRPLLLTSPSSSAASLSLLLSLYLSLFFFFYCYYLRQVTRSAMPSSLSMRSKKQPKSNLPLLSRQKTKRQRERGRRDRQTGYRHSCILCISDLLSITRPSKPKSPPLVSLLPTRKLVPLSPQLKLLLSLPPNPLLLLLPPNPQSKLPPNPRLKLPPKPNPNLKLLPKLPSNPWLKLPLKQKLKLLRLTKMVPATPLLPLGLPLSPRAFLSYCCKLSRQVAIIVMSLYVYNAPFSHSFLPWRGVQNLVVRFAEQSGNFCCCSYNHSPICHNFSQEHLIFNKVAI